MKEIIKRHIAGFKQQTSLSYQDTFTAEELTHLQNTGEFEELYLQFSKNSYVHRESLYLTDTGLINERANSETEKEFFLIEWEAVHTVLYQEENEVRLAVNSLRHIYSNTNTTATPVVFQTQEKVWPVFKDTLAQEEAQSLAALLTQIVRELRGVLVKDEPTLPNNQGSLYPYDPTKTDIDIREDPMTVYELVIRKIQNKTLILNPEFQRNFVWKKEQMSQFIESVILNFPLPPLYLNQTGEGKYIVVDGRQRITTLYKFLNNTFALQGLQALPHLNGKSMKDLQEINAAYLSKIEDKKMNLYIIKPSVPTEVVYDIFNRINTGGTQLQRQEIRNCIFIGKATQLLQELSTETYFREAIDYGISDKRMKDQEVVLRYLAFQLFDYEKEYKGEMSRFLEDTMRKINSALSEQAIQQLKQGFEKAMKQSYAFFGKNNFRFPTSKTRGSINIAMFETVAYFFAQQEDAFLQTHKVQIQDNFYHKLLKDSMYVDAVRFSTADKNRVINRFKKVNELLGEV